ncbi:Major facilitator superfamily domain, general substrate transporter [Niveomyces insectorum RCEF 264]|uniref:Major facilitator superfamily domain, general substrate transporter n=1 Tax=Niveomyces insectorum RCEF 264 TaxID=1081102 RepID=A0A167P291_9HYPO|nr:Major facilitator superfamily domain, general substrate transporter [Niveomyces insectorum RCEF 264]
MAWGLLEVPGVQDVPGTVVLSDRSDIPSEFEQIPRHLLKHGKGKFANVVLAPQPTDSPNDPLNWPTWRKDLVLLITGLSAGVVGAYGPMLSPGFETISAQLGIGVPALGHMTAWVVLTIGLSLFLFNPIAKKIGRRPVYLACSIIMLSSSIWGGVAGNYNSFLASRIWGGLGMAPYEVLVQCTIADMYFVHQRATRIAVWNMFLLCGISGGSLISGYIIQNQGWQWTFIWCAIFFGALLPLVFFFVPETAYVRPPLVHRFAGYHLNRTMTPDKAAGLELEKTEMSEMKGVSDEKETVTVAPAKTAFSAVGDSGAAAENGIPADTAEKKHTYWRSLRVFTGIYSHTPLVRILVRPVVVFFYPAVFWAFLMYGATSSWIVVFSVVNASIFTKAPYNFTVSQTGLISLAPLIATLLGEVASGPLNDWLSVRLAERNNGVYEPEFRLPLVIVPLILGAAGFYGFGATVHYKTHWSGPVLCFGLANAALAFLNSSVFPYVLDAHSDLSEEAFVAINARNFLTFGVTYFVNNWVDNSGALNVFNVLGSVYVGVVLTTIPLWIYGKRARHFIASKKFVQRFLQEE